ncbi:hypothetical protein L7F22_011082 [Adiantum nelumboides]|nr:hypothetical protein [Adiantum nelumboides]
MGSGSLLALLARLHSLGKITHSCSATAPAAEAHVGSSFHQELAQRVGQLQLHGGSAHLNWLLDACACALSTHASLSSDLLQPSSSAAAPALNERADEVLSMLDACTSLKQVADDVHRQLDLLQAALLSARQGCYKTGARLAAARRLQACLHRLEAMISSQYRPRSEAQAALLLAAKRELASPHGAAPPLNEALDGTLLVSLLVLASTLATFAPPTTPRSSSTSAIRSACKRIAAYTSGKSGRGRCTSALTWAAPLQHLQRDLKKEQMSAIFLELRGLHSSASSIHTTVSSPFHKEDDGEVKQRIESLRKRSQEAQACVTALRSQLAALFQALLALRLALFAGCQDVSYC